MSALPKTTKYKRSRGMEYIAPSLSCWKKWVLTRSMVTMRSCCWCLWPFLFFLPAGPLAAAAAAAALLGAAFTCPFCAVGGFCPPAPALAPPPPPTPAALAPAAPPLAPAPPAAAAFAPAAPPFWFTCPPPSAGLLRAYNVNYQFQRWYWCVSPLLSVDCCRLIVAS